MDAMTALQKSGLKNLVLDLRGNGGGLLEEATKIADELLEDGLSIVTTRGAKVKENKVLATKPGIFEKGNIVVLIDEQSASASEVLAGALQDHDRATIVGRRSFGKGLVQEQYNLANGGALRLTVARYFTPLGRGIQKNYRDNPNNYNTEIFERFHSNGTMQQPDTAGKKIFFTRKGKALYEAGGIWPDISIPFDTALLPKAVLKLYGSDLYEELVFDCFRENFPALKSFKDVAAFDRNYKFDASMWSRIVQKSAADSIQLEPLRNVDKSAFEARFKAQVARYYWGNEGYYRLINQYDPAFKKALEYLQANKG
jgi:carboxyl-terminal processing protease